MMNFFSESSSSTYMSVSNTQSMLANTSLEQPASQTIQKDEDEACIFLSLRMILQKVLESGRIKVARPLYEGADPKSSLVFAAGGWVRDKLLNLKSNDIDFIVPNQMVELFANAMEVHLRKTYEEENEKIFEWEPTPVRHLNYSNISLSLKRVNLTINRGEPDEKTFKIDFRELGPNETLIEDCKRRDFRVNSLYYDVWANKVVDIVGVSTYLTLRVSMISNSDACPVITPMRRLSRRISPDTIGQSDSRSPKRCNFYPS